MPNSQPDSLPSTELDPRVAPQGDAILRRGNLPETEWSSPELPDGERLGTEQPTQVNGLMGASLIPVGAVLGDRYRVVRLLGQGGFGRTYLAEDLQRFNESCVLKEFAPQVHGDENLAKARGLFEREAGVLYRLDHDQIPRFRELRQTTYNDQPYLLLIQDFVPGWTYRDVLSDRQSYGKSLSEAEVALMLKQLLPVLSYLHSRGVIHRDIAPDNLIQRERDGLPVLIDFGAVKQAAVTIINEISHRSDPGTRLGKLGYAPPEQMQQGTVYPHSDIYALGATALTLLSGEDPQQLMDPATLDWTWDQFIHLSPGFAAVINRMVALRPRDRYSSARAVLRDLERLDALPNRPVPSLRHRTAAAPAPTMLPGFAEADPLQLTPPQTAKPTMSLGSPGARVATRTAEDARLRAGTRKVVWPGLMLLGGVGFLAGVLLWQRPPDPLVVDPVAPAGVSPTVAELTQAAVLSNAEVERLAKLEQRRRELAIPAEFWTQFIDERFARLHPELGGRELTPAPEDEALRQERLEVAELWLERLSRLEPDQRSRLGSYTANEFEQWVALAKQRLVQRQDFLNRVDARVSKQLPELVGDSASVMQVRRAIASGVIQRIPVTPAGVTLAIDSAGNAYKRERLQPGQARIQLIQLRQGQNLRISLEAPAGVTLSVYRPGQLNNPWVPGLRSQYWEGRVPETGQYQIRLMSAAGGPVEYALNLIVE